ncbi:MAG: hypothetical protein GX162_08270 [Firmicutes bacterium]|jgi:predicted amidophosphoribosyltransferase|nr:hypothetical protein [Bacillota bacterium]
MKVKCQDCKTETYAFREYCPTCGNKLTRSHRRYHSNAMPAPSFILDYRMK